MSERVGQMRRFCGIILLASLLSVWATYSVCVFCSAGEIQEHNVTLDIGPARTDRLRSRKEHKPDSRMKYSYRAPGREVSLVFPQQTSSSQIVVEVSVPNFGVDSVRHHGQVFHKLRLSGYGSSSRTGSPEMPVKGFLLAVPQGTWLAVEVIETESIAISGYRIFPSPRRAVVADGDMYRTVEEFYLDGAAYSRDGLYPETIVELGSYGYLREVRVAQLRVSPIQYNPVKGEILFHRKIWLSVRLTGGEFPYPRRAVSRAVDKGKPFEAIYNNIILNFDPSLIGAGGGEPLGGDEVNPDYLHNHPYKISVNEDGIYEINYQDLMDAGIYLDGVDPRTFRIHNLGTEIPIVVSGEEDGTFDGDDYIEFFAVANTSEYSDINVYWLSWGGPSGLRMPRRDCTPGDSLSIVSMTPERLHFEEDHRYYSNVYRGQGKDHWFWQQLVAPCTGNYQITLPCVSAVTADVGVAISLRGKTDVAHHTRVLINGYLIADLLWDGMVEFETDLSCPQSHLISGENNLTIECPSSSMDQIFFNWLDVEYQRDCNACDDYIRFTRSEPRRKQFEITGFSDSMVELFEINGPTQIVRLSNPRIVPAGSTYKLVFESSPDAWEYLALTCNRRRKPLSITSDEPSDLHLPSNGADYVIICHDDFCEALLPLKALREAEGLKVKVVRITDVYDDFSHGNFTPEAIRDFLSYAYYNWQRPPPSYVLLVGDASFDYKGNIPGGNLNYVPTHLFITQSDYLEACSDDWFAYLVGDDLLADLLIGRLSAQTEAQVEAMVNKILEYECSIPPGDWRQAILLVADNPDQGGDFEGVCERFANDYIIPAGFDVSKVYVSSCGYGCRDEIIYQINDGCVICNFTGHGSLDLWAAERAFQSSDVSALSNTGRLPLVISLTCLNGYFHNAADDYCLAEAFARPSDRGAIACWTHSGLDYTTPSSLLGGYLYDAFLNDGNCILGSAVHQAKAAYLATSPTYWDQAEMLMLFGDPALEMGFPGKADIVPGQLTFDPLTPVAGRAGDIKAMIHNAGREDAGEVMVRFSNGHPDSTGTDVIADVTIAYLDAGAQASAQATWDSVPEKGTYGIFVEVDPEDRIDESGEWNNLRWDSLTVVSPGDIQDTIPPAIEFSIDGKIVGTEFHEGDYVDLCPVLEAVLTDGESGINTDGIEVTLDDKTVKDFELHPRQVGSSVVRLVYNAGALEDGTHRFTVNVCDCGIDPNTAQAGVAFVAESHLRIRGVRNLPNPVRARTTFAYSLSRDAEDVTVAIYSTTGRLVHTINRAPGFQNRNAVHWDGKDRNGNKVASGIYFYRINAQRGSERVGEAGKLVVAR